jgi:hypothetical protein
MGDGKGLARTRDSQQNIVTAPFLYITAQDLNRLGLVAGRLKTGYKIKRSNMLSGLLYYSEIIFSIIPIERQAYEV